MTQTTDNPGRVKIQQLLACLASRMPDDSRNVDASVYDWHLPHFFNSQQMKKVSAFASKTGSLISQKFGASCQGSFEVTITSTSEHFASQFLGQEPANRNQGPNNYYLHFCLPSEESCGFVSIPPQTAVIWTTQLLGDSDSKDKADRPLSELESSLLFDMASLIIEAIALTGEKCPFRPAGSAMLDHLPVTPKGSEEFFKITLQVKKAGTEGACEAHILILCEKLAQAIGESSQSNGKFNPKDVARAIQNHIETIPVPVTAQLACVPVTVEQILNLAVGDILLLDKKIDEPSVLIAAGRTVCRGRCAKTAGNYALVITETLF